jgi:hypothetical protein
LGFYSVSVFAESEHGFELAQPPPAGLPITDFGRLFEANDLAGARAWSAELQKKLDAMNTGPLWAIVCEGWPDTDIITFGNQH